MLGSLLEGRLETTRAAASVNTVDIRRETPPLSRRTNDEDSLQRETGRKVLCFDNVISNGVPHEGCGGVKVKFKHNASPIKFHSSSTYIKGHANLFIGFAIRQEIEDLSFPRTWAVGGQFALIGYSGL